MASSTSGEDTRDKLVDIVKLLYPDALTRDNFVDIVKQLSPDVLTRDNLVDIVKQLSPDVLTRDKLVDIVKQLSPDALTRDKVVDIVKQLSPDALTRDNLVNIVKQLSPDALTRDKLVDIVKQLSPNARTRDNLVDIVKQLSPDARTRKKLMYIVKQLSPDALTRDNLVDIVKQLSPDALTSDNFVKIVKQLSPDAITRDNLLDIVKELYPDALTRDKLMDIVKQLSPDALTRDKLMDIVKQLSPDALTRDKLVDIVKQLYPDALTREKLVDIVKLLSPDALTRDKLVNIVKQLSPDSLTRDKLVNIVKQLSPDALTRDNLVDIVKQLYPDALTHTYVVPPVHLARVPYNKDTVPGTDQDVLVLPSSEQLQQQQGNIQADLAQQHVLHNLQQLGDSGKEVMFVVSELNFKDYLNEPFYAKHTGKLPKPANLPKELRHHGKQGDFDILVIHRQYGILVGEIKSVGKAEASRADTEVFKVIDKAVKQLDKCEVHARHMVSDIAPGLTVRKTLFLPFVSHTQLRRILDDGNNSKLQQAVCQSLGAANTAEAIQLCCCSDQLSQPASYWHVTPAVLSQLSTWWQHRMACTVDTRLTDQLYLDIVARFVGPATTVSVPCYNGVRVEVRTAGQAVVELGRRLALLVLTLQQLGLMNRDPPLVYITGAPGTGKTVVLVLQGVRWLRQGHDVHVLSTWDATRAVSTSIKQQLEMSLSAGPTPSLTPGSVSYHRYDILGREADVEQAVNDLLACVKNGHLHVLLDEAFFDSRFKHGPRHTRLVTRLAQQVPHLYLWCAGVLNRDIPPALQTQVFTVPLRSAPAVLREIQPVIHRFNVHDYSDSGVPAPGDGLSVIRLSHHGNAHTSRWPVDCAQCGQDIAAVLRRLGVGRNVANSPSRLSYRDVFVLTRSGDLNDDVTNGAGRVTSPASGVVQGLKDAGVPVSVLGRQDFHHNRARWERAVQDVAVAATDTVTVAGYSWVTGLERRVVAVLQDRRQDDDDAGRTDEWIDLQVRLDAVSRCTTQLITVRTPPVTTTTTPSLTTTTTPTTTTTHTTT
ncbi:uncharacterized protein [Littorina saxatilis]|uniref:uncharacterized protein isoform X2 n=1 Tax=Littorina saxatilis TaxID=31220 RepID=UPI0038B68E33